MANASTFIKLSGSTQGKRIKVTRTSTPGDLLHTTGLGLSTTVYDRMYLNAMNSDTVNRILTIEFGGVASPDDTIVVTLAPKSGLRIVVDGDLLAGDGASGLNVRAFADSANVVTVGGIVGRTTP